MARLRSIGERSWLVALGVATAAGCSGGHGRGGSASIGAVGTAGATTAATSSGPTALAGASFAGSAGIGSSVVVPGATATPGTRPSSATGGLKLSAVTKLSAIAKLGPALVAANSLKTLRAEYDARRAAYLQAAGKGFNNLHAGTMAQFAKLEVGLPVDRKPIEDSLVQIEKRQDTSDFGANELLRLLIKHGNSPLFPQDLKDRTKRAMLNWKYAIDEPGQTEMCFWSENHQILFATAEYLAGQLWPTEVFTNTKTTGQQHRLKARPKILKWLDYRLRFGFSEWNSPVYYEEDLIALFNLVDFCADIEIRERTSMVLDVLFFDFARLTHKGSFGVTAGRAYEEHKFSGWGQSVGDTIEVLFGTRGRFQGRGSAGGLGLATSRNYTIPTAVLAIGKDVPTRSVDRTRYGISFAEAPAQGISTSNLDDGLFWWGMGAYTAKETIVLSRKMIRTWNLWNYDDFKTIFKPIDWIPDFILPTVSNTLSPVSEGSVLSTANVKTFRTPDAMLSSVQSYRKGQLGFQQHAWQATLSMDAVVFTTHPGNRGHDGPTAWTGSASLPRVVQHDNVAVILYNPALPQKVMFGPRTHAWFPQSGFDEVIVRGPWTFGRKGDGYVGLYSALPARYATTGPSALKEIEAPGWRNAWICQVGRKATDGTFLDIQNKLAAARVAPYGQGNALLPGDRLGVSFDSPGVGRLDVDWEAAPRLNGGALQDSGFPRWENPYTTTPFGARKYTWAHAGAKLVHDLDLSSRTGDGL